MHIHKCYNSYIEATGLNTWTVNLRSSWFVLPKFEIFGAAKEIKYTFSLHLLLAACVPWLATVVHELYCSTPLWICFFVSFLASITKRHDCSSRIYIQLCAAFLVYLLTLEVMTTACTWESSLNLVGVSLPYRRITFSTALGFSIEIFAVTLLNTGDLKDWQRYQKEWNNIPRILLSQFVVMFLPSL